MARLLESNCRGIAILPCAGVGKRMGGTTPKFLLDLGGTTVLELCLRRFAACPDVDDIILVLSAAFIDEFQETILPGLLKNADVKRKLALLVEGGTERQHSIWHGLLCLTPESSNFRRITLRNDFKAPSDLKRCIVAIHDAVRPFIDPALISKVMQAAAEYEAALLAIAAQDTIKSVDDGEVVETLDRKRLYQAQTPQAFSLPLLLQANRDAVSQKRLATDDASLVEAIGHKPRIVIGDRRNLKVTTPEDFLLAKALWQLEKA